LPTGLTPIKVATVLKLPVMGGNTEVVEPYNAHSKIIMPQLPKIGRLICWISRNYLENPISLSDLLVGFGGKTD